MDDVKHDEASREGIAKAHEYAEAAAEAAKKLDEYREAAAELAEKGKALSTLQNIAKNLTWLSKVATVVQVASIGLGLLEALFPAESDTDKILKSINKLSKQIDGLKTQIEAAVEALKTEGVKTDIWHSITEILATSDELRSNNTALLLDRNPTVYSDALTDFLRVIVADGPEDKSLMQWVYHAHYGDPYVMAKHTAYLRDLADKTLQCLGAVYTAKQRKIAQDKGEVFGPAEAALATAEITGDAAVEGSPNYRYNQIIEGLQYWSELPFKKAEIAANTQRLIEDTYKEEWPGTTSEKSGAKVMQELLSEQFDWLQIAVFKYPAVRGYDKHAYATAGHDVITHAFWEKKDDYGVPHNYVVYAVPRLEDADGTPHVHNLTEAREVSQEAKTQDDRKRLAFSRFVSELDQVDQKAKHKARKHKYLDQLVRAWPACKSAGLEGKDPGHLVTRAWIEVHDDKDHKIQTVEHNWHQDLVWLAYPGEAIGAADALLEIASEVPVIAHMSRRYVADGTGKDFSQTLGWGGLTGLLIYPHSDM